MGQIKKTTNQCKKLIKRSRSNYVITNIAFGSNFHVRLQIYGLFKLWGCFLTIFKLNFLSCDLSLLFLHLFSYFFSTFLQFSVIFYHSTSLCFSNWLKKESRKREKVWSTFIFRKRWKSYLGLKRMSWRMPWKN